MVSAQTNTPETLHNILTTRATSANTCETSHNSRQTIPESHAPTGDFPGTTANLREIASDLVQRIHASVAYAICGKRTPW